MKIDVNVSKMNVQLRLMDDKENELKWDCITRIEQIRILYAMDACLKVLAMRIKEE